MNTKNILLGILALIIVLGAVNAATVITLGSPANNSAFNDSTYANSSAIDTANFTGVSLETNVSCNYQNATTGGNITVSVYIDGSVCCGGTDCSIGYWWNYNTSTTTTNSSVSDGTWSTTTIPITFDSPVPTNASQSKNTQDFAINVYDFDYEILNVTLHSNGTSATWVENTKTGNGTRWFDSVNVSDWDTTDAYYLIYYTGETSTTATNSTEYLIQHTTTLHSSGSVNSSDNMTWDTTYSWTVNCDSNVSTDVLYSLGVGEAEYEIRYLETVYGSETKQVNLSKTLQQVGADDLYLCNQTDSNITVWCYYSSGSNFTGTINANLSLESASCIVSSSGFAKSAYTLNYINDTYFNITFNAASNGTMTVFYELTAFNDSHKTNNMRCTGLDVGTTNSPFLIETTDSFGNCGLAVANTSAAAKTVMCSPDPNYTPSSPSNIPVALLATLTILSIAAQVTLTRREQT